MPISPSIVVTTEDGKRARSSTEFYVPSTTAFADIFDFPGSFLPLIDVLIGGQIVRASICLGVDLSGLGLKTAPVATSDVEEGARFIFGTALSGVTKQVRLPTFLEGKIVANNQIVDTTDPDVIAFVNAMTQGLTPNATLVEPSDYRDEDLTSLLSAREDFQRTRKLR